MKYVHEVEISEIKEIGEICGKLSHAYFYIKYKDGSREKFTIATKDNTSYHFYCAFLRCISAILTFCYYNFRCNSCK